MKDLAKWELARTLIGMMEHKTIDKITVRDICKACGTSTQNFYYHFKDKFDLLTWYYIQDIENVWYSNPDRPGSENMHEAYEHIWKQRDFYRNGFEDNSDNSLVNHIIDFEITLYTDVLKRRNVEIDKKMEFVIRYHSCACAEMTRYWLLGENPVNPKKFTELIMDSMPVKLREPLMEQGDVQLDG